MLYEHLYLSFKDSGQDRPAGQEGLDGQRWSILYASVTFYNFSMNTCISVGTFGQFTWPIELIVQLARKGRMAIIYASATFR